MKKHFTFLAALGFVAMAMAGKTLTPDEALARLNGNRHLSPAIAVRNAGSMQLEYTVSDASDVAAVYLFSEKCCGRYLVLSADDMAVPVLGYSDSLEPVVTDGSDMKMPPQLKWWLDEYARQIGYLRNNSAKHVSPLRNDVAAERQPIAPLCRTKWGQGEPYNTFCPVVNGETSITGCGATALAQVMKYHQWPVKGTGTGVCTDANGNSYSMDLGEVDFDWANMLDVYTESSTQQQNDAVAQLMKVCGYAVGMEYSPRWSNSSTTMIAAALKQNFGYAKSVNACQMLHYGMEQWEEMIYDNLVNAGPVIYRGNSISDGGHIFVCDGYSTDGYFHFNWGWNGSYDGYFKLSALNPYVSYTGIADGGFSQGQWAILGIRKPGGNEEPVPVVMTQEGLITCTIDGSIATLQCGWWNYTGDVVSMEMGMKVEAFDKSSDFSPVYVDGIALDSSLDVNYGWYSLSVDLAPLNLPDGLYKLTPVCRDAGLQGEWQIPLHTLTVSNYSVVEKKDNSYEAYFVNPAVLTIENLEVPSAIYSRRNHKITMTVRNETSMPVVSYVTPVLSYDWHIISQSDGFMVALAPGESIEKDCFAGFSFAEQEGDGVYRVHMMDYDVWAALAETEIVVAADPGAPVLSCSSFSLDGGTQNVSPDNLLFTADVECTRGYHANPLELGIYKGVDDSFDYMMSVKSTPVFLTESETARVNINISLDEISRKEPELYAILFYLGAGGYYELGRIPFTIDQSGVEHVAADDNGGLAMRYDSAISILSVESANGIKEITILSLDGKQLLSRDTSGSSTSIDLSPLAKGVYIAVARDCSGAARILKIRK